MTIQKKQIIAAIAVLAPLVFYQVSSASDQDQSAGLSGEEILRKTARIYQTLQSYTDVEKQTVKIVTRDTSQVLKRDVTLTFQRPNKLKYIINQQNPRMEVVSDGTHLYQYKSPPPKYTKDEAPAGLGDILKCIQALGLEQYVHFVAFVLAEDPYAELTADLVEVKKLPDQALGERKMYRLSVKKPGTELRLLIDKEDFGIRKATFVLYDMVEYLHSRKREVRIDKEHPMYQIFKSRRLQITSEISEVSMNVKLPKDTFKFTPPSDAALVDALVEKQHSASQQSNGVVSETIGKPIPGIVLATLDGTRVSLRRLKGRIVVLGFWTISDIPSRMLLPAIERLHRKFENSSIMIITANSEDRVPNIKRLMEENEYSFPVLVDDYRQLTSSLSIESVPTIVVFDTEGNVYKAYVGYDPEMEQYLERDLSILWQQK